MIGASVGFQCPECVHSAPAPQPVTPAGGTIVDRPYVTYALIAINIAIFGLSFLTGIDTAAQEYGMYPPAIATNGEYFRLLTSAFLHGGILHILFNMYVLFALGPTLERILGHVRYTVLFLMAAIGGAVASYFFSDVMTVSVGASGAIFGLMGALVVAGRRLKYDISQVLILLGINVVIGFASPGVDWRAHLGGLVIGAVVAAIFVYAPRQGRIMWQSLGVGGVFAVLVVMALVRTAQIQSLIDAAHSVSA